MHIQKVHEDEDILNALNNLDFSNTSFDRNEDHDLPLLNIPDFLFSVFISAPYMIPNLNAFKTFFEKHKINVIVPSEIDSKKERLEEEDLMKYIGKYNIALIGDDRYTANIIKLGATSSNKKLIGLMKWGTGIDSIDQEAARQYNVVIKNTVDAFTEPVAESILGSILCFNRGLLSSTRMMQDSKHWVKVPGKTLHETTFGIVGFGNVGKAIATKLLQLGSNKILTYDILGELPFSHVFSDNKLQQLGSLNDILKQNPDFLIITCSANKDNIKMISKTELSLLNKGNTVLINMARGSLIDEPELIKALQSVDGLSLKGAALDVYWNEPLPHDSVLRTLPNVILTSHNANSSPFYWLKVHLNTIKNTFELLSKS